MSESTVGSRLLTVLGGALFCLFLGIALVIFWGVGTRNMHDFYLLSLPYIVFWYSFLTAARYGDDCTPLRKSSASIAAPCATALIAYVHFVAGIVPALIVGAVIVVAAVTIFNIVKFVLRGN